MNEREKPPSKLRDFLVAVRDGSYDDDLLEIQSTLDERRKALQEKVLIRVKEVFGPNARVVDIGMPQSSERSNPFVERVQEKEEDQPMPDALSSSEQRANEGEKPVIESRGAIIGGISSSDIAE